MGAEVCSEIPSLVVSPRISFSHDLKEADSVPVESHHRRSDASLLESSTIDFNFNFSCSSSSNLQGYHHPELLPMSSADELFANGKILPVEVKKITTTSTIFLPPKQKPSRELLESKPISACLRRNFNSSLRSSSRTDHHEDTKKKSLKEFLSINSDDAEAEIEQDQDQDQEQKEQEEEEVKKPTSSSSSSSNNKPFWQQFRRSSSLNFDTNSTNSLIRSLHFLSRSNSTGSAPNPNPKTSRKVIQNKQQSSTTSIKRTNSSSSSSSSSCTQYYYSYKNPSLKKNHSNGGHGVRITPVLHIPHACISRNSVLLGFSSLFCNGKSKKKKKSV